MKQVCPHCKRENYYSDWGLSDFYVGHVCLWCGKTIPPIMEDKKDGVLRKF